MGRIDTIRGRGSVTPFIALAMMAALLASVMTPATAESPFNGTVAFVDPAPRTASPGGTLDTFEVEVDGSLTLPVVDLIDSDGTLALTASIALLQGGDPVSDAFSAGETSVLVRSVTEPEAAARALATFQGLTLSEDLLNSDELPGDDAYELRVTIELGEVDLRTTTAPLEVTDNAPPVASFVVSCDELTLQCQFEDTSTDDDGTIEKWVWNFGDGSDGLTIERSEDVTTGDTTHTYAAAAVYTVRLTVTDDGGLTNYQEQAISATDFASDFDEVKDCDDETCDFERVVDGVAYTIQGPVSGGRVGVSFDIVPDAEFLEDCRVLQETFSNVRLLEPVTLVVPTGFSEGDFFTVTMSVPKRVINEDTNRGNFGVCFRDEPDPADPENQFKGRTRLLPDCGNTGDLACIVSRNRAKNGTLALTFQFPAVDPMFR